ncbi:MULTISPECIES: monovalent cation/H(+) antiporter subunit G [Sphingomonas]|jgi:multicomponent K+:H+ antiporter subunit G|uniref:monovalent cation/H(+) antiporter subunit G n=1 Tax=Sphingomonas TaxID=13687 RepID=UPI000A6DC8D1|nr:MULTISPECIES: monovalent cation/H(+) antiporter subunit G [Sphingomonas]MDF2605320.1 potassium:proton antiporter [Sphingomonas sp.]
MIQAPDLPGWAALLVGLLVLAGAGVTLIGSIGLLRLNSFFDRVHAPTLGASLGMLLIVSASIVCFSVLRTRPSIHELLVVLFLTCTAPAAFMLLARSALYRTRAEKQGSAVDLAHDRDAPDRRD